MAPDSEMKKRYYRYKFPRYLDRHQKRKALLKGLLVSKDRCVVLLTPAERSKVVPEIVRAARAQGISYFVEATRVILERPVDGLSTVDQIFTDPSHPNILRS